VRHRRIDKCEPEERKGQKGSEFHAFSEGADDERGRDALPIS
jgi:hypothetical protein